MQLAVIGDVHRSWTDADNAHFDASSYAGVLFVGDLPSLRHAGIWEVAGQIGRLQRPAWLIPGNHDATSFAALLAEVAGARLVHPAAGLAMKARVAKLREVLANVQMVGYSHHTLREIGGGAVGAEGPESLGLIAARPHAMGGGFSFGAYLAAAFDVRTMAESTARLCEVVDACPHDRLIFLAHNGPAGLGAEHDAIFGADFRRDGGDWGDPDLTAAVAHAKARGKHVLAVVAGHMHHRTKQRKLRPWRLERDGVLYINAACVPRVFKHEGQRVRHHVRLTIEGTSCTVAAVLVPDLAVTDV